MLEKKTKDLKQIELVSIEDFVPKDHLLRKINSVVDFDKIYEIVEDFYCKKNGRPRDTSHKEVSLWAFISICNDGWI